MIVTDEQLAEAADRIARTQDGQLLYLYLQKVLLGVTAQDMSDCALQRNEGRRSFASELMGLMTNGVDASDGTSTGRPSERAVIFARRQPSGVGRRLTAREWLANQSDEFPERNTEPDSAKQSGSAG